MLITGVSWAKWRLLVRVIIRLVSTGPAGVTQGWYVGAPVSMCPALLRGSVLSFASAPGPPAEVCGITALQHTRSRLC